MQTELTYRSFLYESWVTYGTKVYTILKYGCFLTSFVDHTVVIKTIWVLKPVS